MTQKTKMPGSNLEFVREDDYVEYYVFPKLNDNLKEEQQMQQEMKKIRLEIMALVQERVMERSYIWHKDEFNLQVRTGSKQELLLDEEEEEGTEDELLPHLKGVTHYGDNINDEWFIVYLLTEITKARGECIARVKDADGEFLLIEAADHLPEWANPERCEKRVYLVNGQVQLIQDSNDKMEKEELSMTQAVRRIRMNPNLYRCSQNILNCIEGRLKEFQVAQPHFSIHRQIVEMPQMAAQLLKMKPSLISSAVRAFCERDAMDNKDLRTMRYFPPEAPRVCTNVRFTRCLYAMLMHNQYIPERRLGWQLSDEKKQPERFKEQIMGIKLASGLEILASQAKRENLEDLPAWRAYLRSLQGKGYFRDLLEGSVEYQRLKEQAKDYFQGNQQRFRLQSQVGVEILDLLKNSTDSELRDEENNLQPSDKDDWLNISPEELDTLLKSRYGPANPEEFTKKLSDFLEQQSHFEGIETQDERLASLELDSDDDLPPQSSSKKLHKNPSMRQACHPRNSVIQTPSDDPPDSTHVRNFLDFVIPEDNWDSTSEMSDYADEEDLERNFDDLSRSSQGFPLDRDIQKYMEQMDRELAQTSVGQTFMGQPAASSSSSKANEDDFADIEDFEPININVNTLRNMMDSYQSQVGGAGPVSHLFNAMGVGMSKESQDLSESSV